MNRKNRKNRSNRIFLIVIVIVLLIILVIYGFKSDKKMNAFSGLLKDSSVEVTKILSIPFKGVNSMLDEFLNLRSVYKENKILKSNIDKLESLEAENLELKDEINKLKEELNIDYVLTDYDYLNATVISRNTLYWYNILTINKGSHSGIKEGMVVMNSTGLIGKVINVSTFSSDVKLITTTDTNNKISVSINNGTSKVNGLITSYSNEEGYLKIEGISNTEEVNVGDYVYTSGLGGIFPGGILIGKVESITTDVYDLAKVINVVPSADFSDINYVTVLKRKDNE